MKILTVRNNGTLKIFKSLKSKVIIGRGFECDLQIFDESASRRHCTIEKTDDGYILTDLETSAGTKVNEQRVYRRHLESGDTIAIGETKIIFDEKSLRMLLRSASL